MFTSAKTNELKSLFPNNKNTIDLYKSINPDIKWEKLFYKFSTPLLKEKMYQVYSTSTIKGLLNGIKNEFGLDGCKVNMDLAFKLYKESADGSLDLLSMYRMYKIYLSDYTKFGIKQDRALEKFYLFKCFAYGDFGLLDYENYLCFTIDVHREITTHIAQEDRGLTKLRRLLYLLKDNNNYNISREALQIIGTVIPYSLHIDKSYDISKLEALCFMKSNEGLFKISYCLNKISKDERARHLLNILVNNKEINYKICNSYGSLLYNNKKKLKCFNVLKEGTKSDINCFRLYYSIYLTMLDFPKIKDSKELQNDIFSFLDFLLSRYIYGDMFFLFEFLYLAKISIRHFNLKERIIEKFKPVIEEIYIFLKGLMNKKNECLSMFMNKNAYVEMMLNLTVLILYQNDYNIKVDISLKEMENFYKKVVKEVNLELIRKFYYNYLYKLRKKICTEDASYTNKFEKTKKKLFNMFRVGLDEEEADDISSSVWFSLGRIYEKGIGVKRDLIGAFSFYYSAHNKEEKYLPFSPTLLLYRKYKGGLKMRSLRSQLDNIEKSLMENDEERECSICFTNLKNVIVLPCLHKFCDQCYTELTKLGKCPYCRGHIIMKINYINIISYVKSNFG